MTNVAFRFHTDRATLTSPMTQAAAFDSATRLIDRFKPSHRRPAGQQLQMRVLVGGTLLGLAVSSVAAGSAGMAGLVPTALVIGAFGCGLLLLLAGVRAGVPMRILSAACIVLLGAFFMGVLLLPQNVDWAGLKWLTLLPLVALLLEDAEPEGGSFRRPIGMLLGATILAIALGVVTLVCHRLGWTFGLPEPEHSLATDLNALINSTLFTLSVSGLLIIHHVALRKAEEELALLRSMLSVCAWCRRIRDDEDGWVGLEHYMSKHTTTRLTHGICPECERKTLEDAAETIEALRT